MKRLTSSLIFFFSVFLTFAQNNYYDRAWKRVDSLVNKAGLTRSALTEVNKIYQQAVKEKNEAQTIKALVYRISLNENISDDNHTAGIRALETAIRQSTQPAKSILQSILAEQYFNYFQENRWRLYDRTRTVNFNKDSIDTWGVEDFHTNIASLYSQSISASTLLKNTSLGRYDPIIVKGNSRRLRPTLFDLLAHRALDYFRNDERDITRPAYSFEINDTLAFAEAAIFAKHRFVTRDTASFKFKALQLYQELINFHLNDVNVSALLDVNIDRIQYLRNHSIVLQKDSLYLKALRDVISRYGLLPASAQAQYLIAGYYAEQASRFTSTRNPRDRNGYITARDLAEPIVRMKDSSEGKANASRLLQDITRRELRIEAEKVNIPGEPFRMMISFRNLSSMYTRVIALDQQLKQNLGDEFWGDDYWQKITRQKFIRSNVQLLPDAKDYQPHRVEIKTDALPPGEYAFLASASENFELNNNPMAVQYFHVSSLAAIQHENDLYVRHRLTGAPIAYAAVQMWYQQYNSNAGRTNMVKGPSFTTDNKGYMTIPSPPAYSTPFVELMVPGDRLLLDEPVSFSRPEVVIDSKKEIKRTFLFTDRSVYRPGQWIYFKGIMVRKNNDIADSEILSNFSTSIVLLDANRQKVDSIKVTSNEFGAYSGKFILPQSGLNGTFSLQDNQTKSMVMFRVEEYKRPTFEVQLQKPAGSYSLGDSIRVTGNANAFAGYKIGGAQVQYRVVRQTILPWWGGWFRSKIWPPMRREEMEITNGVTTTATDGSFQITFNAIPDLSIDRSSQPVFHYTVHATITDVNGETRTGSESVAVGYQSLRLQIEALPRVHEDSLFRIKILSTNLNDVFQKSTIRLDISQLEMPPTILRPRYWEAPDTAIMTKAAYRALFPHDIYMNEDDPANWKKTLVTSRTDTSTRSGNFRMPDQKLQPGWYLLEAKTVVAPGDTVVSKAFINIYSNANPANPYAFASINTTVDSVRLNTGIPYQICSNLDSLYLIHQLQTNNVAAEQKNLFLLSDCISMTAPSNVKGNTAATIVFIRNNRFYSIGEDWKVAAQGSQLNITYSTYRDKTLPGSNEKWSVNITGADGERVTAELLMTMYDASLDAIQPHRWTLPGQWSDQYYRKTNWIGKGFEARQSVERHHDTRPVAIFEKQYDYLFTQQLQYRTRYMLESKQVQRGAVVENSKSAPPAVVADSAANGQEESQSSGKDEDKPDAELVPVRKNFNETAFFFPELRIDSAGNVQFSFTMPEALTSWKWMTIAHTKNLAFGYQQATIITQKELMVQPNAPRFFREGDRMDFSARLVNMSEKELTGQVELQLVDPITLQPVDGWFRNMFPNQYFTVAAAATAPVNFTIEIPFQYNKPVIYRVIASSGTLSDGEENTIPVLSNRMLVTETKPLPIRGTSEKHFTFDKLLQSGKSESLNHHALTVEFTANPAWFAVQALPYMMENAYENSESLFNRYYANAIASKIANSTPAIRTVFEKWKIEDTTALYSMLQKNQELKTVLLQETPWVLQANSEAAQKRNLALLFDMVRMSEELSKALAKLKEIQSPSGGFMWFKGGPEDRYMTQYIISGFGRLRELGVVAGTENQLYRSIVAAAIKYLDSQIKNDYALLVKKKVNLANNNLSHLQIQFLYLRSMFKDIAVPGDVLKAYSYYRSQSQKFWLKQNRYMQGMIALSLYRSGDVKNATAIVNSLKQNAIFNDEMGMYWKDMSGGYYWHQAPVETQALLLEAFHVITKDTKSVEGLKTWLLKNKQTNDWKTSKATADACYALLLQGANVLANTPDIEIRLGDTRIQSRDEKTEAGTGYFKKVIAGSAVKPAMGDIQVFVRNKDSATSPTPAWGAVYWQYFEDMDKITHAATPLSIRKQLFIEKSSDRGPVLQPVALGETVKVGDRIKVRIELRVDRAMEYVHMQDARAAGLEPVNVLSNYKWQGGLGYYESTTDASTHFFFQYLPKGTFVFEYALFVTHSGTFSNGITTIQSMYAPEFSSHSEGVRLNVD